MDSYVHANVSEKHTASIFRAEVGVLDFVGIFHDVRRI
jgi:hypothetical protein